MSGITWSDYITYHVIKAQLALSDYVMVSCDQSAVSFDPWITVSSFHMFTSRGISLRFRFALHVV